MDEDPNIIGTVLLKIQSQLKLRKALKFAKAQMLNRETLTTRTAEMRQNQKDEVNNGKFSSVPEEVK